MRRLLILVASWLAATACHAELPTLEAIDALHADAAARIAAGRFDSLLAEADKDLQSRARFADGRWKLAILLGGMRRGFAHNAASPADWNAWDAALKRLAARHPGSPNAWLFVAIAAHSHAWAERGAGFSDTVSDEGAAGFTRRLEQARATMDDVLQRYPDEVNAQRFFHIACERADKAMARHLLPWVKSTPSPSLTDGNVGMFEQCRAWTQGRTASFAVLDPETGRTRIVH